MRGRGAACLPSVVAALALVGGLLVGGRGAVLLMWAERMVS
jgi:hypothetical protein